MQRCGVKSLEYLVGLLLAVSSATALGQRYLLTPPPVYVAFSGDLQVNYTVPTNVSISNAFVSLLYTKQGQKDHEITTLRVNPGRNTGTLIVSCGVLEYAGTYTLKMYMFVDGPLLTQSSFTVIWPKIALTLPQHRFVLGGDANLRIISEVNLCEPKIHRESFYVELYYKRRAMIHRDLPLESSSLIKSFNFTHLSIKSQNIKYECGLFDIDGAYQAVFKSTFESGSIMNKSNVLNVTWNGNSYGVDIHVPSAFPCSGSIPIYYVQPGCARVQRNLQDRIRMYELRSRSNGSLAVPLKEKYLLERFVDPRKNAFGVKCKLFNTTAAGFCFKYYSVSKNGAVGLRKQTCIPARPDSVLYIDGGWGEWSGWSDCTVDCGSGRRNRFRICNNPLPLHGGRYCGGEHVEWRDCHRDCEEKPLPIGPLQTLNVDIKCACGCHVTSDSGEITASGRCAGAAVWILEGKVTQVVKLQFRYFDIMRPRQLVQIRNGESIDSDLLYTSIGGNDPDGVVTSSSHKVTVELMTHESENAPRSIVIFPRNATLPIHLHGFILSYSFTEGGGALASTIIRRHQSSILDSKVAIVGISLCVLIVLVVIAFVVFHRVYHTRHKYAMAASNETPEHVARSTSMHSSRTSSPPPGITSVDVEAPLTEPARKDVGVSRGSSISSTCSAGFKKLRSKAESVTGSPKPSTKNYSPLPSPYTANSPPDEYLHSSGFFKSGNNLKTCKPRSPKIHPSSKFKHSPVTPMSPSKTKHDMLTKKRKEQLNDNERIVTGSSGSSKCAPIALAETPTPSDNKSIIPVKDSLSVARTPADDKTPQNEVIILESLRDELKNRDEDSETTSFIQPSTKARRPTSLTDSYSSDSIGAKPKIRTDKDKKKKPKTTSAMEERQTLLPKPDGQSPKSPTREEHMRSPTREEHMRSPTREVQSKCSTPRSTKSSRSSKSAKTMSPTRSIHTPSDLGSVDIDLEYDDFIDDDPLSYFEVSELQKLKWSGGERIGKPVKD